MTGSAAESGLWRFALAVYGSDGVPQECLALQDRYGVDVPILLCTLWMARRGAALDAGRMARLVAVAQPWHETVVKSLRAVRTGLKHGPHPAPSARTERLRDAVKAAELDAERIELAVLADTVEAEFPGGPSQDPAKHLAVVLRHYAGSDTPDCPPMTCLLRAARDADLG